ncbi:MAG: hypothetical protein NTY12_03965 [Candidatus Falkowbacteria bacterium]|nr:hypothetical protein [Candidatus Falkowbacteria bacterium]
MKKVIIGFFILITLGLLCVIALGVYKFNFTNDDIHYACTMEAKLCPDGSSVGRSGPDCAFAQCPKAGDKMTEAEAEAIAVKYCVKGGEALEPGIYNSSSKTWWFDANLNSTRNGCNPACVVSEETRLGEINWRCTGLAK